MAFDPKMIQLFDISDTVQSVIEWIEKAELICQLSGVKCIECVVPMHLSGGAYAVYQQLSKEKKILPASKMLCSGLRYSLEAISSSPLVSG